MPSGASGATSACQSDAVHDALMQLRHFFQKFSELRASRGELSVLYFPICPFQDLRPVFNRQGSEDEFHGWLTNIASGGSLC